MSEVLKNIRREIYKKRKSLHDKQKAISKLKSELVHNLKLKSLTSPKIVELVSGPRPAGPLTDIGLLQELWDNHTTLGFIESPIQRVSAALDLSIQEAAKEAEDLQALDHGLRE